MSRVEGSEKRSLLGREPSRRFEGSARRKRPTVGQGSGGFESEDGGFCNDCLARCCGLRNGKMRSRCCLLIVFLILFVGAGFGAYYGYEKYVVSSSDDGDDGDDGSSSNHHKHSSDGDDDTSATEGDDDTSASTDGSVDVTGSDDGKRDTDKADHGADFLPAGGANTDDEADEGFGARIRRHLRGPAH